MKLNLFNFSNIFLATSLSIAVGTVSADKLTVRELVNLRKLNVSRVTNKVNILNSETSEPTQSDYLSLSESFDVAVLEKSETKESEKNAIIPWMLIIVGSVLTFGAGGGVYYQRNRGLLNPKGVSRFRGVNDGRVFCCSKCKQPMEKVEDAEVISKLSEAQKIAHSIGSVKFEGWRCKKCTPESDELGFHLVAWISESENFQQCPHCQELTVKRRLKTLAVPTQKFNGIRLIVDKCQLCSYYKEKEKTVSPLPSITTQTGKRKGWNSDSYDYYGSSFGAGDFGGGDGGGCGGGDGGGCDGGDGGCGE